MEYHNIVFQNHLCDKGLIWWKKVIVKEFGYTDDMNFGNMIR